MSEKTHYVTLPLMEFMPLLFLHSERCKVEAWMGEISKAMFPKSDAYNTHIKSKKIPEKHLLLLH